MGNSLNKKINRRKIMKNQICPVCNKEYTEHPAISRVDNKTEICSECGTIEAMTVFMLHVQENRVSI